MISPKMSTYLLAWAVGEFDYIQATTKGKRETERERERERERGNGGRVNRDGGSTEGGWKLNERRRKKGK
jgi:hypothetical protein